MLELIKTKFYEFLRALEYNVSDNGVRRDEYPWLMLHFNDAKVLKSNDLDLTEVRLTLDIFSTYNGEKEILAIIDNINKHIKRLIKENDFIQYASLRALRIIDDPETGVVRKHGIAVFSFMLTKEDVEDGE